jgi:hypothetical protein
MRIARLVTESVVYLHVVAVTLAFMRHLDHNAVSGCVDGVTRRTGEVHSRMALGVPEERV